MDFSKIPNEKQRGRPYKVISHIGRRVTYDNFMSGSNRSLDISQCKRYYAKEGEDPRIEATKGTGLYIVENVTGHYFIKGRRKSRQSLMFKIKWSGYEEIGEEPFTNNTIRDNIVVRRYMENQEELKQYIPK